MRRFDLSSWHMIAGDYWRTWVTYLAALVLGGTTVLASLGLFATPVAGPALPRPAHVAEVVSDHSPAAAVLGELISSAASMPSYQVRAWPNAATSADLTPVDPLDQYCTSTGPLSTSLTPMLARSVLLTYLDTPTPSSSQATGSQTSTATSTTLASQTLSIPVTLSAQALGAGLGPRGYQALLSEAASCAHGYLYSQTTYPGREFVAVVRLANSASLVVVVAQVADVVLTLSYAASPTYPLAQSATSAMSYLTSGLTTSLASVCANPTAPASDATRNPSQSDYHPYLVATTVYPPNSFTPPDMSLLNAAPPTVVVPPTGTVTTLPSPPTKPTVALSTSVMLPTRDTVGPGCGWAFTGATSPPTISPDPAKTQAALSVLEAAWTQWPQTVFAYLNALAQYNADLASYDAWLSTNPTTTTTTTSLPPSTSTSTTTTTVTSTTTTSKP